MIVLILPPGVVFVVVPIVVVVVTPVIDPNLYADSLSCRRGRDGYRNRKNSSQEQRSDDALCKTHIELL